MMDIKTKVRRKLNPTGTPASGCCEYSYNLTIKIKDANGKQIDNIWKAVLRAIGE